MTTSYRVTSKAGELLGIFPKGELAAVKALVVAHPGAEVKPVVSYEACSEHPAYEVGNCPLCGTSRSL